MDKRDKPFLPCDVYLTLAEKPLCDCLDMLTAEANGADASRSKPIFLPDSTPCGQVTSGAYGHAISQSLVLGYVENSLAQPCNRLSVASFGRAHEATLLKHPLFDPDGLRLRG